MYGGWDACMGDAVSRRQGRHVARLADNRWTGRRGGRAYVLLFHGRLAERNVVPRCEQGRKGVSRGAHQGAPVDVSRGGRCPRGFVREADHDDGGDDDDDDTIGNA